MPLAAHAGARGPAAAALHGSRVLHALLRPRVPCCRRQAVVTVTGSSRRARDDRRARGAAGRVAPRSPAVASVAPTTAVPAGRARAAHQRAARHFPVRLRRSRLSRHCPAVVRSAPSNGRRTSCPTRASPTRTRANRSCASRWSESAICICTCRRTSIAPGSRRCRRSGRRNRSMRRTFHGWNHGIPCHCRMHLRSRHAFCNRACTC